MVDSFASLSRLRPERTSRASLGTGPSTEHRSVPDGVQVPVCSPSGSLQPAARQRQRRSHRGKGCHIRPWSRSPRLGLGHTTNNGRPAPLRCLAASPSRAAWRGCKVPPDTLPSAQRPAGIGAGAAYRPCQVPQCHFVALDPPHLRQDQDHSPSRHGPHPARHGYEEGGGGVPGVGASSGTAHDFSYISEPPGAHLGPCSDCFLIPLILIILPAPFDEPSLVGVVVSPSALHHTQPKDFQATTQPPCSPSRASKPTYPPIAL